MRRCGVLVTTDYLQPSDDIDQFCAGTATRRPTAPRPARAALTTRCHSTTGIRVASMASEPVNSEILDSAAHLHMLARSGVGYDSIDVDAVTARGIAAGNTPGVNHNAVAEMAIALMLMAACRLAPAMPATNCAEPPWVSSATGRADAPLPTSASHSA
jgi:lactate dehydrogenase-like 2-hydroxyacid dehydrogenase